MPLDPISNPSALASGQPPVRALATIWRVVIGLSVLAGVWTLAQVAQAMQAGEFKALLPSALLVYAAGIGYLALTAIIALRSDRSIRAGQAPGHSRLAWIAHFLVVGAALLVAGRGESARGVLVGLGASLMAWGVVAILALIAEKLTRRASDPSPTADQGLTTLTSHPSSIASACLACVAVLGL